MKKIILLFVLLLATVVSARAERVVVFEGDNAYHLTVIPLPVYEDGVTLLIYGTVRPEGLFMYGDHASSLSTESGTITSVVFERVGSTSFSFSNGNYYSDGSNCYWSGNSSYVSFVPSQNVVARRIVVTIDDSGNNDDPTGSISLCDLLDVEDGTTVSFDRQLVVLWQAGRYLYVKDMLTDCFGLIYGSINQTYQQGDVIPAGWTARKRTYGGEPELGYPEDFAPSESHVEVTPEEITAEDVNHDHWAHYVVLKNVMVSEDGTVLIDENGNEISYYNRTFGVELPIGQDHPIDVYGIVGSYKPSNGDVIYQLLPTSFFGIPIPEYICCLQDLLKLYPQYQYVDFECPLIVIYQGGNYLYFKDTCEQYGLIYGGAVGGPFENGDRIIGSAYWTTYQQVPQLGIRDPWRLVGHGPAVQPEVACIEDMNWDQVHSYVRFEGVKIVTDEDDKTYIEDESGNRMPIYNRFNVSLPTPERVYPPCYWSGEITIADVNFLIDVIISHTGMIDWDGTYDMNGFIEVYYGTVEFTPTEIIFHGDAKDYSICDLNSDGEINIADVNDLINIILW